MKETKNLYNYKIHRYMNNFLVLFSRYFTDAVNK